MASAEDRRLRRLRPPKPAVDAWRPLGVQLEQELTPEGSLEDSLTIFLAGQECPFTCIFCDLWRYTTDDPTPPGAIPRQIHLALEQVTTRPQVVKLYNASNFFDRAVPPQDDAAIADLVRGFRRVVVECHPRLLGRRCFDFARRLEGRLEVAMGFETAHPGALERLNKGLRLQDLRSAADRLRAADVDLRAFVLIGAPYVPAGEELLWVERTVAWALECGARLVSLIPLRGGEGELARLEAAGAWQPPDLETVEEVYEHCRRLETRRVRLDTWDLEHLSSRSAQDLSGRLERLRRLQLSPIGSAA